MGGRLTDRFIFMVDQPLGYSKEPRSTAEMHFDEAVLSPPKLRALLVAMPKGAELHYHLTGGGYAENLIRSGANRGACIA
jgi:adenosine deaminase